MKVLIIGAGMYVTGRGGHGVGTVLSALAQFSKEITITEVIIVATSKDNESIVVNATAQINKTLRTALQVSYKQIDPNQLGDQVTQLCRREKIGAAIVSTPDHIHFEPIKALINARVHSLVVKPFVPSVKEARELLGMQLNSHMYGAIEFHKRFDESNLYAKKTIAAGTLGKVQYITVDYSQRIVIPTVVFSSWAEKTNIFQYLGVHYVDLIYYMTNFRPSALCAYGSVGTLKNRGIDTFDSVHVMLEWQHPDDDSQRFISQMNISWIDPNTSSAMSDQKFKIIGTKGRLECDQKNRGIELVTDDAGIAHTNPYFSEYLLDENGDPSFGGYGYKSIAQFLKDVIALNKGEIALSDLNQKRPSFKDALVSTAVIDTVNKALKDGPSWRSVDGLP